MYLEQFVENVAHTEVSDARLTGCPCTTAKSDENISSTAPRNACTITNLDVAPEIRTHGARALREIDLLVRICGVEGVLVRDASRVAVERDARERALGLLHLQTNDDGQISIYHKRTREHSRSGRGIRRRRSSCGHNQ